MASQDAMTPALPPGLADLHSLPRETFLKDMSRHPLFMQTLNPAEENVELEALQALAYEGTPLEIATNFKVQGNEAFREKRVRDALEFYTKGIRAGSGDEILDRTLLLNRAACHLELQNYGKVLEDCGRILRGDGENVKALYRSARACFALDKLDEAEDAITRAIDVDKSNKSFQSLLADISKRRGTVTARTEETIKKVQYRREVERSLKAALKARDIIVTPTPRPPDLGPIDPYHLTDPLDPQSDLLFPTLFLYPLPAQSDLIAQLPLRTTLNDHLAVVFEALPAWDAAREYTPETVECFMEIEKERGRGLIKIGKGMGLEKVLKGRVILDGIIRIFVLPKTKSREWVAEWSRNNTQA